MIDYSLNLDSLFFIIPLYVNDINLATSTIKKHINGTDINSYLSKNINSYHIDSEDSALSSLIHYYYNNNSLENRSKLDRFVTLITDSNDNYETFMDEVLKVYKDLELNVVDRPGISVVDSYPYPFHKLKGRALAPDKTDQERYDIPNTMYLRKEAVRPIITPAIVSHELFHYHVNDNGLLARGLEEAIADFVSIFIFCAEKFGESFAFSYYIEMRYARGSSTQRFELYIDDMYRLIFLIEKVGWDEIAKACRSGRKAIKELEYQQIDNFFAKTEVKLPEIVKCGINRVKSLIFSTPRNQVISPSSLALILSNSGEKFTLTDNIRLSALDEIQNRIFGVLHDDGIIEFDDFINLSKQNVLIIDTIGRDT